MGEGAFSSPAAQTPPEPPQHFGQVRLCALRTWKTALFTGHSKFQRFKDRTY